MEAFQKALPVGAMNFVSGRGRDTMPVLMETGKIDTLAFIGGSGAADTVIRQHPHPHRLKIFLQLEAKNMGIFLPDMFEKGMSKAEELSRAVDQSLLGGTIQPESGFTCLFSGEDLCTKFILVLFSFELQWTTMYFAEAFLHS